MADAQDQVATDVHCERLKGRVAVVTGAAHGIGRAIATRFAQEGASVALVDVLGEAVGAAAEAIPRALAFEADVTDPAQVDALVGKVRDRFGDVSILVNNAGGAYFPPKPAWEMSLEDFDFLVRLNLTSQWLVTQAVLPSMRAARGGKIVNITSNSRSGRAGLGAYGAAKAGVVSMTRTLSQELGEFGINVNAVSPGFIRFTRPKTVLTAEEVAQWEAQAVSSQSLRQLGQPEHIAAAVAFLASPDADHITGQVLSVDGG